MDGEGEGRGGQGEDRRGEEGKAVARDVGSNAGLRWPWVEPTPISTVERTATPVALPTWRMVLKKVEARPMDSGVIMAKAAAWFGTMTWAIIQPSTNMRPRMNHRLVVTLIWVSTSMQAARPEQPAGDVPAWADARVDEVGWRTARRS